MNIAKTGLLTLTAPQLLEEELVDFFLSSEQDYGFTSLNVRGHSSEHRGMSVIEQVTGRQQQVQFQIVVSESEAREICNQLETSYPGVGVHYWYIETPLQGRF